MTSTYLELCNRVVRRIGEVEIQQAEFPSLRGVHALVKDAVRDAVNKLHASNSEWPFNAYEHTLTLDSGVNEYAWTTGYRKVDWNSFQIQKDDNLNVRSLHLTKISRDEWYDYAKDRDDNAGVEGLSVPRYVFESHGYGFGVTPVPDKEYILKYRYFKIPEALSTYDSTTTVPEEFEYVIIDGALWHMNMFRENDSTIAVLDAVFRDGIKTMTNVLIGFDDKVYDRRIR